MTSYLDPTSEIERVLGRYEDFSECVVDAVQWSRGGTHIEVSIDYRWNADGTVRRAADDRILVRLQFGRVQEIEVRNRLNGVQLDEPERLDWGISEISRLVIGETARSRAYAREHTRFYEASFQRESGVCITIVFADFDWSEIALAT